MESEPDLESEDARLDKGFYAGSRRRLRTCRHSAFLHQCGLRGITGLSSSSLTGGPQRGGILPPCRAVWLFGDNLAIFACHRWGRVLFASSTERRGCCRTFYTGQPRSTAPSKEPAHKSAGPRLRTPV